jgi:transcriptional regulator with GAF, ATPase, and Fis domain
MHEKAGAFTDARRNKLKCFALPNGGIIFLDEIGDISPAM